MDSASGRPFGRRRPIAPRLLAWGLAGGLAGFLAACGGGAGISTGDRLTGTIPRPTKVTDARAELAGGSFPNLASVPDGPPPTTAKKERTKVLASLEQDRGVAGSPASTDGAPSRVHVADIYFADGASELDAQDRAILQAVAERLRRLGGRLRVVGHSSGQGAESPDLVQGSEPDLEQDLEQNLSNFRVSLARARSVAESLARFGVARDRLLVEALAASQPVYAETTPAGEAGNRRVEIFQEFGEAAK